MNALSLEKISLPTTTPVFHAGIPAFPLREPGMLTGVRVLLVEDVMDNRLLLRRILERAGARVACAADGSEALAMARCGAFDIVLMDLHLPVMDGFEAQRTLREEGFTMPIIAVTASCADRDKERTMAAGFNDHLAKPYDFRNLLRTVAKWSGSVGWNAVC